MATRINNIVKSLKNSMTFLAQEIVFILFIWAGARRHTSLGARPALYKIYRC